VICDKKPAVAFNPDEIITKYPNQNTFFFENGIEISSEFDSGNMGKCFKDEAKPNSFIIWLAGDG
jgi:hypothetical protein